jgi:hypothetical protein
MCARAGCIDGARRQVAQLVERTPQSGIGGAAGDGSRDPAGLAPQILNSVSVSGAKSSDGWSSRFDKPCSCE